MSNTPPVNMTDLEIDTLQRSALSILIQLHRVRYNIPKGKKIKIKFVIEDEDDNGQTKPANK